MNELFWTIVQFGIVLSFLLLPAVYLFVKQRRWSKSLSVAHARTPRSVRAVELSVLGLLTALLVLHIATGGFGHPMKPLPDAVRQARTVICGGTVGIAALWLLLGVYRSLSLAVGGLIVSLVGGALWLQWSEALSYARFADDVRRIPVPVEITLKEQLTDVDVFINGVRMGQAPLRTTMEEIAAKAPEITVSEEEYGKGWKNFRSGTYLPQVKLSLDRALDVDRHDHDAKPTQLYVRFELRGQPLMIYGSNSFSGPSRMFGMVQPARIPLSVMTDEWDRDVTLLLEKARLSDYRVDAKWLEAAETYFHFVRAALQQATQTEPAFQRVLTDWAKQRYQLEQVTDADGAWRVFESIGTQADELPGYHTDSIAGEAVELLLEWLDADRLVSAAEQRLLQLAKLPNSPSYGWTWQTRDAKFHFGTAEENDPIDLRPSDFVLAHAIWRLDQTWDAADNTRDNAVEQRLVPVLLRLGYHNESVRKLTAELGGATVEELDRRQQRLAQRQLPSEDWSENTFVEGVHINRRFWGSVNSVTPAGAQFRKKNAHEALALAKRMMTESHWSGMTLPNWMDFLFLEVAGRDPLARDFLTTVENTAAPHAEYQLVGLLWTYLGRIRPLPESREFAAVFAKHAKQSMHLGNTDHVFSQLPLDLRFELVRDCLAEAAKKKAVYAPNSEEYSDIQYLERDLERFMTRIPSEAAADVIMGWLDPAQPQANDIASQLKHQGTYGLLPAPLFSRLAKSSRPEHRLWVIPQIRLRPDASARAALDRLLTDEDQTIRAAAKTAAAELTDLRRRPLPKLN